MNFEGFVKAYGYPCKICKNDTTILFSVDDIMVCEKCATKINRKNKLIHLNNLVNIK
jgi:predicted nucleic acid-binding Zn ribbon protein